MIYDDPVLFSTRPHAQTDLQTTVNSLKSQLSSQGKQLETSRQETKTEKAQVQTLQEEARSNFQRIKEQMHQIQELEASSTKKAEENRKLVQQVEGMKAQCMQVQELAQEKEKVSYRLFYQLSYMCPSSSK